MSKKNNDFCWQDAVTLKEYFNLRIETIRSVLSQMDGDVRDLRESKALLEGKASQKSVTIAYIISFLSLVIALISLFVR